MVAAGRSVFPRRQVQIFGPESSLWPLERNCKAALILVSESPWIGAVGHETKTDHMSGDQLCGVGLSVRFNSHLISVWHRDASKQKSIDAILATVLEELPDELKPRPDNCFYKKHSDHAGFKPPATAATIQKASEE